MACFIASLVVLPLHLSLLQAAKEDLNHNSVTLAGLYTAFEPVRSE